MNKTDISWTTFSANPLKYRTPDGKVVWACVKTSPGCANCYSEALANRWDRGKEFIAQNMEGLTPFLDEAELKKMLTAKTIQGIAVSGSRVFVGDMTDVFGAWVPDELLDRLFAVFALRPGVTWQVLTKRAQTMWDYCSRMDRSRLDDACGQFVDGCRFHGDLPAWPLPNVHLGVSVENQQYADERLPWLINTPAAVRFISYEPALGPLTLRHPFDGKLTRNWLGGERGVSWVIAGGESGPNRRPCEVEWFADLALECKEAGVAFHMKQDGGSRPGMQGRIPLEVWQRKEHPRG